MYQQSIGSFTQSSAKISSSYNTMQDNLDSLFHRVQTLLKTQNQVEQHLIRIGKNKQIIAMEQKFKKQEESQWYFVFCDL